MASCGCKALISVPAQRGNPGHRSAISKLSMLLYKEGSMADRSTYYLAHVTVRNDTDMNPSTIMC